MPFDGHSNFGVSTVATAPAPATTGLSLTVATGDGAKFPATPFNAVVWPSGADPTTANAEIVRVTAVAGDVFTIARTQEGTTARTVIVGDMIAATVTVRTLTDIESPIATGWIDDTGETWTYASGSGGGVATFTVPTDLTAKYTVGTRIKLTQTTVKYFVVSAAPAFAAGVTTVTIMGGSDYTLLNAAISANCHSYAANPQGYPGWFNYDCQPAGFSGTPTQRTSRFSVVGRACHVYIDVFGTSNSASFGLKAPIASLRSFWAFATQYTDNGSNPTNAGLLGLGAAPTTTVTVSKDWTGTGWTGSGSKSAQCSFFYEI